ncbi:MAG: hypothetical protein ACXW5U_18945 [Thermoanaerobaculia bacterium]
MRFKNAVINGLDAWFGTELHYDRTLEERFSIVHGSQFGPAAGIREILRNTPSREALALTLDHLLEAAAQTPLEYRGITKPVDAVAKAIGEAIQHHPGIALRLVNVDEDMFELHPAGAAELDAVSVDQTLAWLAKFPAVQAESRKALRAHADGDFATSLNSARQVLEMLFRAVLANSKSLENQIGSDPASPDAPVLRWMRERGAKPQTVTLAQRVVASFCDLQNSWVKHLPPTGATFDEAEAEYALYAAFVVARLITRLAGNERPPN